MNKLYCRIYQSVLRAATYFMRWPRPQQLETTDAAARWLRANGLSRVLLVTGPRVRAAGLPDALLNTLKAAGVFCEVFDAVTHEPDIATVEKACAAYRENNCAAVIGLGGGSPLDCAKAAAARLSNPGRSLERMRGVLTVRRRSVPLICIPTTAGSGSETTVAAVISDSATHRKYAMTDPALVPDAVLLDPALTAGLPPRVTAETGLDALCHAVEAYIGRSNTRKTREYAAEATRLILSALPRAYADGNDLDARADMLRGSHLAGLAFTRAYVGYVHAVAHSLGGKYGTPHGLSNAIALAPMLRLYGKSARRPLAGLSRAAGLCGNSVADADAAEALICEIEALQEKLALPCRLDALKAEDIPALAAQAASEGNPLYPVPKEFSAAELEAAYRIILPVSVG